VGGRDDGRVRERREAAAAEPRSRARGRAHWRGRRRTGEDVEEEGLDVIVERLVVEEELG
jgi:hypothetical protein